ncbi:MAG: ice-binding family protein [Candidatus Doudnabacteria bacterium]
MIKKRNAKKYKGRIVISLLVILLMAGISMMNGLMARAATTPNLGAATSYAILASSFINTFAGTTVNGDIGFTTGPAVHPLGTQLRYGSGAPYSTAGTDQGSALVNLNAQLPCDYTFPAGAVNLGTEALHPGGIGVYLPGIYCTTAGSAAQITGTITLNGAGTYIFRIFGALTSSAGAIVQVAGASPCDVFWTATSATSLADNTTMLGTVIDDSGITTGANVNWTGRALSFGGVVTTGNTTNIATPVTCAGTPPAGPGGPVPVPPLIDVLKVPSPLSLPGGPGSVTYTYSVRNIGTVPMSTVRVTDDSCGPVNFVSGDTNANGALDLTEVWIYNCATTLAATHTNTVTATGFSLGLSSTDTATATVVVGAAVVPPLIHVVKIPYPFTLPAGGGAVTYRYTVTNPGTVALSDVTVTDNKCTGLPGRVVGHPGDINQNNLLEPTESWSFTCISNLTATTLNTATASGTANGITATDLAFATVVVAPPATPTPPPGIGLAATGYAPAGRNTLWNVILPAGMIAALLLFYVARKKRAF